jgi:hypothetical protein
MLVGAVPALAHGRPGHGGFAPVQGQMTYVGNGKLQVSTNSGVVTVALNPTTKVVRVVSGSTADLHANQLVDMHIVPGTTTVDMIRIEGMAKPPASHPALPKHREMIISQPSLSADGQNKHLRTPPGNPPNFTEGQVVSASDSSITIRTLSGKVTYSISNTVTVTKLITGSQTDLAVGEMVQVFRGRDGSALSITIMSA